MYPLTYHGLSILACEWAQVAHLRGTDENVSYELGKLFIILGYLMSPSMTLIGKQLQQLTRISESLLTLGLLIAEIFDKVKGCLVLILQPLNPLLDMLYL
jgi:hypothetical protein